VKPLRLRVQTPPAEEDRLAVSIPEMEAYLRLRGINQMPDITTIVAASQILVEQLVGPLVETIFDAYSDSFAADQCYLPAAMVKEVVSVHYHPAAGGPEQLLAPSTYYADVNDPADYQIVPASISLASGMSWPGTATTPVAVRIRYKAGWPAGSAPEILKAAVLSEAAWQDRARDGVAADDKPMTSRLMAQYRIWRSGWVA
jgi:hypothetical protein